MKITGIWLSCFSLLFSTHTLALSADAETGKSLYPACHVCHNPDIDPPLGAPMFGIQRQYKNITQTKEEFIQRVVAFAKAPSQDMVIMKSAANNLGLMQPMPLPDDMLIKIATYIYEENFAPPCTHWRIAIQRMEKTGDTVHMMKDRKMYNKFCE